MKRFSIIVTVGAGLLLALTSPIAAVAHVTVAPDSTPAGSWALIDVKVPNESATAVTNKVELALPTDTPVLTVSYVPVAGWTTELVRETLPTAVKVGDNTITEAVTKVIWTATTGHEISAGQLQIFPLSLGPIPDTGKLVLIAEQTYSDGTIVSWSDTTDSAKHPAPVLYVNDAPPSGHHDSGTTADDAHSDHTTTDTASVSTASASVGSASSDTIARSLGIGGLVVGLIGVVVAVAAMRRKAAN